VLPTKKHSVQEAVVPKEEEREEKGKEEEEEEEEYDTSVLLKNKLLKKRKTNPSSPPPPCLSSPLPSPLPKKKVFRPDDLVSARNDAVARIFAIIQSQRKDVIKRVIREHKSFFVQLGDTSQPIVVNDFEFSFEQFFTNTTFQWDVRHAVTESMKDCHVVFPQNQKEGEFGVLVVMKEKK
jgi:hypothetical protein